METSDKKLAQLNEILDRGTGREITSRITMLRREKPFAGALKRVALHYDKSEDAVVREVIATLFNDLKEAEAIPEVIEALDSVTG